MIAFVCVCVCGDDICARSKQHVIVDWKVRFSIPDDHDDALHGKCVIVKRIVCVFVFMCATREETLTRYALPVGIRW